MGREAEPTSRLESSVSALAALSAVAFLVWRARAFFPGAEGLIGADYRWFFPTLMAGQAWFQRNGWLSIPHFTPAFCGGVPLFANPQSVAYSLPQLLLVPLEPINAMLATLLISAAVGALGCHAVLKRCFSVSTSAATLGAVMFLLNGFVFYRLVYGHLTYHAFALAPALTYVVLSSHRSLGPGRRVLPWALAARVVAGGAVVAYFTYGGALNFQVPLGLTVLAALLILEVRRGFDLAPWLVLGGSFVWGALLSMMKLVPAAVFVGQFPRRVIPFFLFTNPVTAVVTVFKGFFFPSALATHLRFQEWAILGRHEFEFGVSVVPLLLAAAVLLMGRRERARISRPIHGILIGTILLIPLALSVGTSRWGLFLLQVPVINSNTTFVRWWAIDLVPIIIATALWFDGLARRPAVRAVLLVSCAAIVALQLGLRDDGYYRLTESTYAPFDEVSAHRQLKRGGQVLDVTSVGPSRSTAEETGPGMLRTNDAFLEGRSARPCYEPIFGYFLELTPPNLGLVDGPVEQVTDGRLNLVDPAEYLSTSPLADRMWRFADTRLADARRFAAYQPYNWSVAWWMRAATGVTLAAFGLSMVALIGYALSRRPASS
jgi:hypothetical protein